MALPMLVNGADCGPVNPLQSLSKRLDQDRGLQQDFFGPGKASGSRQVFRTQQAPSPSLQQDVNSFFTAERSASSSFSMAQAGPSTTFNMSTLASSLPMHALQAPSSAQVMQQAPKSHPTAWADDFMKMQPDLLPPAAQVQHATPVHSLPPQMSVASMSPQGTTMWRPQMNTFAMGSMVQPMSPAAVSAQTPQSAASNIDPSLWESEFLQQERLVEPQQQAQPSRLAESDDLARAAQQLVDAIQHEQNPKFKNSAFLRTMHQLASQDLVLEGDQIVANDGTHMPSTADIKGKGRALYTLPDHALSSVNRPTSRPYTAYATEGPPSAVEDANDAYFRQENEDYIKMQHAFEDSQQSRQADGDHTPGVLSSEWAQLQGDWDRFEATSTGIRPVQRYRFAEKNPYLLGGTSRTRTHMMHHDASRRLALYDSVLEMEAAVQREPSNASAWFDLGVKQQESEREHSAIAALQRALDLDPSHLPSRLALAVSYTNEGHRMEAFNAIREWIGRNGAYEAAVRGYRQTHPETLEAPQREQLEDLTECLIAMARSVVGDALDADIQIALAVVLNNNEDYARSGDCFRAALAARPEDWLLWNRVGATLANGGNAEEALQYYSRAVELNPVYIRARYNMGIAYINLRRYDDAAHHLMDAIALQESESVNSPDGLLDVSGVTSSSLWDSLKTTCGHMKRPDLVALCSAQDLEGLRERIHMVL